MLSNVQLFISKSLFVLIVFVIKNLGKTANNLESCISVFKCLLWSLSILMKSKLDIMGAVYVKDSNKWTHSLS